MPEEKKWYVFYCKSRAEKKANEELRIRGYESYLPMMVQNRVWSDRIKKVSVPMLSGYIFVNCYKHEIYSILEIRQIVGPVRIGKEYAQIRQSDIDILQKTEINGLKVFVEKSIVTKGDLVEISAGVLRNLRGLCVEEAGNNYFIIAIEGINQSIKIKIDKELVRKI